MLKVKSTRIKILLFALLSFVTAAQAQNVTLADQTGEATSFTGGQTDVPILAFNLTRGSAVNLTGVTITFSSPIAGVFTNVRLFESSDAIFSGGDNDLGTLTLNTGNDYDISSISSAIGGGAGTNYFIVVDIDPDILSTTTISASCVASQIVTTDTETGGAAGPIYDNSNITELSATFTPIPAGTAPVPTSSVLAAGVTTQVLTGFSVSSTGTQTISEFDFNYTPGSSIVAEYVYKNTAPGTLSGATIAATDLTPDGDFTTGVNEIITSTTVYYYLVVDVAASVTTSTGGITIAPTEAGITVDAGTVNAFSINRPFTFNTSQLSDIIFTGGASSPINYRTIQATSINDTNLSLSQRLATFEIQDGGGATDGDNKATSLTSITIQVTNPANIRQIALFDDVGGQQDEIAGTEQTMPGSGIVTFTPNSPIRTSSDGSTFPFMVRVTFNSTVTDNDNMVVTITSVTGEAGYSGFLAANAGGANSTAAANKSIIVTASKLIFVAPLPSPTPVNTLFSLTLRAVDGNPYNNRDLDATGQIDLTVTGGAGSLSGGAQSLSPNLALGQFSWTGLTINQAGSYTLDASDDAYSPSPDLGDASTTISIISSSSTLTPSPDPLLCYGSTASFKALGNIVITETDNAGISGSNGSYTFSLALPSGFVFDQSVTSGLVLSGGGDLSSASAYSYPGSNIVQFSFTLNGTSNLNTITIGGLKARYPHPGTVSPAPTGVLSITRLGGTATISGVGVGVVLGTISATQAPTSVSFTVAAIPGNVAIDPNTTDFNVNSSAVNLVGSVTPGVFTGSGVTFSSPDYRFNPNSLSANSYPITYTYTNGANGCQSVAIKSFTVFASGINNLNPSYCSNDLPSPDFSVSQTFLDQRFGGTNVWHVDHYVYYDVSVFNFVPITSPSNTKFDPTLAAYKNTLQYFGGRIPVGFAVCDGSTVPCNGLSTTGVFTTYQWVTVKTAPTVSFTIPKTSFCADEAPVVLTGTPANSNNTSNDNFSAIPVGQQPSISNGGSPVVWSFHPQAVTGVALGAPVSFDIAYTYTEPATGCSNTSAPQTITVNARPSSVAAIDITSGVSQQICQGASVNAFTAASIAGTSYNWYSDSPPVSIAGTGSSFTPAVNTTVAAISNFYITRTINGCESNKEPVSPTSPLQLSVDVKATPTQPVPNFNRAYCIGQTIDPNDLQITSGTSIKWYRNGSLVFTGSSPNASNIANPVELNINNSVASLYSFDVTQTVAGCEGILFPTKIDVTIKALPVLSLVADADPLTICKADPVMTFTAFDGNTPAISPPGIASWTGVAAIVPNPPAGTAQLNPAAPSLTPGNYVLTFNYTNASTNCANSKSINLTVFPTINPSISIGTACDKSPVDITNNSSMVPANTTSTIASTEWTFKEQMGSVVLKVEPGLAPVSHLYMGVGTFPLNYVMTTSDGCVVTPPTESITINPKPIADFDWSNVCRDVVSSTQFNASTKNIPPVPVSNYNWNFNVTNSLTYTTAGVGANPVVNYNKDGKDTVKLVITSIAQCKDTIQKPVFIIPSYPAISENNAYSQDFNATTDGWLMGGVNSSWQYGKPAATIINKDSSATGTGNAWVTNLTGNSNSNEQSWVLSPCFDFTQALKPVLSIDIWSDTPRQIDGAVLQYNENSNIENNSNWKVIGQINQGVNGYDVTGIASKPGNQSVLDIGWSGDQSLVKYRKGWVHSIFKLDGLIGKPSVKFRIAFASNFGRQEGFAFDNIFIGERSRSVLIENFTNSSSEANSTAQNNAFNNFGTNTPNEVVKVQFHTGFPSYDTLNSINKPMNNSRTAFYGITNSPTLRVDGKVGVGVLTSWFSDLYDERVLSPSQLKIVINPPTKIGDVVHISSSIKNTSPSILNLKNANVFTIIAEKSITTAPWLGNSGNSEFKYVAKEMLPTASGIAISKSLAPGETFTVPDVIWSEQDLINLNNGVVIVYVQNLTDKEVFQAKLFDNPTVLPNVVTGTEPAISELIQLYPRPADQSITLDLTQPVRERTTIQIFDVNGHEVENLALEKGQQSKGIDTQNFANGVYLILIDTDYATIRKKIVVVHQ